MRINLGGLILSPTKDEALWCMDSVVPRDNGDDIHADLLIAFC